MEAVSLDKGEAVVPVFPLTYWEMIVSLATGLVVISGLQSIHSDRTTTISIALFLKDV